MKYKIKITTKNDGTKIYEPFVKGRWGWETITGNQYSFYSRQQALDQIDYDYGYRIKSIEFEYINK